jgi:hypothetical protein
MASGKKSSEQSIRSIQGEIGEAAKFDPSAVQEKHPVRRKERKSARSDI